MEEFSTLASIIDVYGKQSMKHKFVTQHDQTRKFQVFKNFTHFSQEYPRLDMLHEVVFASSPRKFVADIECKLDPDTKDDILPKLYEEVAIIKRLITVLFLDYQVNIYESNFITIDSCGIVDDKYKFSINLVVDELYFVDYREFQHFGLALVDLYEKNKKYDTPDDFIDPQFYRRCEINSHFQVRIPGHTKFGQNRPKKVLGNIDPLRAIITNIAGCTALKKKRDPISKEAKLRYRRLKNAELGKDDEHILELTKHLWEGYFVFRSREGNIFSFDRIAESHCRICDEVHHTDNQFYITYWGGALWERCRHAPTAKSKFIASIGGEIDIPAPKVEPVKSTEYISLDPVAMFPGNKDVYLIRAHMKMGKTEECIKYIKQTNPKTVIIFSFRRAFSADMKARYEGFSLYSDLKGPISIEENPRLIIQIESLDRIQYPLPTIDLVILDEIESIWGQFGHSGIGDYYGVVSTFKNIVGISKKIICMDADLNGRTIRLLKEIRPKFDDEFNFYKNNYNPSRDTTYSFLDAKKTALALMLARLKEGKKIVIVTNSIKLSEEVNYLIWKNAGIKSGIYNSKTKESKKLRHFSNVNHYWTKYNCLIYTPTITSGVSFTADHFDIMFGMFNASSCNVETCKQMMGRIRNLRDKHVYVHVTCHKPPDCKYDTKPEIVRDTMKYERAKLLEYARKKYNLETLTFEYDVDGHASYYENLAYYIISENIAFDNRSRNSFSQLMIHYLKKGSIQVNDWVTPINLGLSMDFVNKIDYEFKVRQEEFSKKRVDDIMESPVITKERVKEIQQNIKLGIDITPDDRNSMIKYKMESQLKLSLTEDITEVYKPNNSESSRKTKQYIACCQLFDMKDKLAKDFKGWRKCMENSNYLKDATYGKYGVVHVMVGELFETIDFGKTLATLMIQSSPMKYPNFGASTTAEFYQKKSEYWLARLPMFREYIQRIMEIIGLPKASKLSTMDQDDLLLEFIRILSNFYGVTNRNGSIQGSSHIIFKYDGVEYLSGAPNVKNRKWPIVQVV